MHRRWALGAGAGLSSVARHMALSRCHDLLDVASAVVAGACPDSSQHAVPWTLVIGTAMARFGSCCPTGGVAKVASPGEAPLTVSWRGDRAFTVHFRFWRLEARF